VILLYVGLILLAVWVLGFLVFHVLGSLIHLALIIAVIALVWHFVSKGARRL
jgi:uncharacterized membrane protein (DUF485 family)